MGTLSFQQAFERIRAEYLEMPGMRLTPPQVQRLSGIEASTCRLVLEELVRTRFLRLTPDGSYARCTEGASPPRTAKAEWRPGRVPPASRRAG